MSVIMKHGIGSLQVGLLVVLIFIRQVAPNTISQINEETLSNRFQNSLNIKEQKDPNQKWNAVDVTNNNDVSNDRIKIGNEKWILLTTKYTKKQKITDFRGKILDKAIIMNSFQLDEGWKRKISENVGKIGKILKLINKKSILKNANGNAVTILATDITMQQSAPTVTRRNGQYNITCSKRETYNCSYLVYVAKQRPCWRFSTYTTCTYYEQVLQQSVCERQIQVCCPGYYLAPNGYCHYQAPEVNPTVQPRNGCGGTLTSREGVITSTNYPKDYPNNQNCTWRIQAPYGSKIIMKIVDLEMEDPLGACDMESWNCYNLCDFDYVQIYDVTTASEKTLCGFMTPYTHMTSAGSTIDVKFESDLSSGGRGFKLVYGIVDEYQLSSLNQCTGGRKWQKCRLRCARTCQKFSNNSEMYCLRENHQYSIISSQERNEITCIPGCSCPPSSPIWHNGACVKPEACPGTYFECGKPAVVSKPKIVGGKVPSKYAWPWMVQIESDTAFHICGATLICSDWVVTAAHCFLNMRNTGLDLDPKRYLVNVGKYWKHEQMDGREVQTYEPKFIIAHNQYNKETDLNDIAIIQLKQAVDVTDFVRPACLPNKTLSGVISEMSQYAAFQQPTVGTNCVVLGWGTTRSIGPTSHVLKEGRITVIQGIHCQYDSYDWKLTICAGGRKNEDTCRGDSGGPFLCERGGRWVIDGVTSFGDSCGDANVPGGYTRISHYINWIRQYVGTQCGV